MRRWLKSVLLFVSTSALTLVGVEVALRIGYPHGIGLEIAGLEPFPWLRGDPVLGWANASGYRTPGLEINSLGMRGPEVEQKPELRVLCLGDSRTFGVYSTETSFAAFDSEYPAELRKSLGAAFPDRAIEVLNLGVVGYTSSHVLRQLNTEIRDLHPDVLVVGVGFNDLLLSWDPGLRTQEPASSLLRVVLYASSKARITQLWLTALEFNPLRPKPLAMRWVELDEYKRNLARIIETARGMHVPLLLIHQPLRALRLGDNRYRQGATENGMGMLFLSTGARNLEEVHHQFDAYRDAAFQVARELKAPLLDVGIAFQGQEQRVFGGYDLVHYNPYGAQVVARAVQDELERLGWLR